MAFTLFATSSKGTGLRLRMVREADRLASRIELVLPNLTIPLLESMEGRPGDTWPPSPPWQQCQNHPSPTGAILATGMAGSSFWSASIESHTHPPSLVWDVACRARQPTPALGSIYRVPRASVFRDGERILLEVAGTQCRLRAEPVAGSSADLRLDETEGDGVQVGVCVASHAVDSPRTIRWKYRLELELATPLAAPYSTP